MGSVTIGSSSYQVYGTLAGAQAYWNAFGTIGDAATWWTANPTQQAAALVQATRLLDRQAWAGTPVGVPQVDVVLQWPRSGVKDRYGAAVASNVTPDGIINGAYQLAAMIGADPSIIGKATSGDNIKSIKAGPVAVDFFVPILGITGRFPTEVEELVGDYLVSGSAAALVSGSMSTTSGQNTQSSFGTSPGDGTTNSASGNSPYDLTRGY